MDPKDFMTNITTQRILKYLGLEMTQWTITATINDNK